MTLDWTVDVYGERDDDIECGEPATFNYGGTFVCDVHADALVANGDAHPDEVEPLP